MLIKQFVRKNAINSEVFLWKIFQKKANSVSLLSRGGLGEPEASTTEHGTSSSSTRFSSEVSHPGTNQAQPCLASVGD